MSAHTELLKVDRARRAIAAESQRVVYRMPRPSMRRWCKTHLTGNQAPLSRRELLAAWCVFLIVPAIIVAAILWHAAFGVSP